MLTKCASAQVSFRRDNSTVYVPSEFNSTVYMASEYCKAGKAKICVFFNFIFFENIFYRNIFSISHFTVMYPYRPAGGRQGRICKFKKKLFARTPLSGACRPAGGRQAPHHCIKASLPPPPSFASHDIQRAGGREEG